MVIENVMYFALGVLLSALLALVIMPAVWRRAVRLTKKRIEAATPITMAEFRADKDQLRAEFALSTRRLEMHVEALRRRLAEQLSDINRKKSALGGMKGERDNHLQIVRELEEREGELRRRILELEKESADLAQKLRMRDREFADKSSQLDAARESLAARNDRNFELDGERLSGDYEVDVEDLLQRLELERKRAGFLESQNRTLITQLESSDRRSSEASAAAAELRQSLAEKDDEGSDARGELVAAEARMADAENRVSQLLEETSRTVEGSEAERGRLLAEKLDLEAELETLRAKVRDVESTVLADWDSDRIEQSHLRERLNDIAADVSRLVYAVEGSEAPEEESLFDRVQRFAADGDDAQPLPGPRTGTEPEPPEPRNRVSDRLAALREIRDNL